MGISLVGISLVGLFSLCPKWQCVFSGYVLCVPTGCVPTWKDSAIAHRPVGCNGLPVIIISSQHLNDEDAEK